MSTQAEPEQIHEVLGELYRSILRREPDSSGLAHFEKLWIQDDGPAKVIHSLLTSTEYRAICKFRGTQKSVAVIHVPKSAGTSLREVLLDFPGTYPGPLYFDATTFTAHELASKVPIVTEQMATSSDLMFMRDNYSVVIGHFFLSSLYQAGFRDIRTVIREPRSRILSTYRFFQTLPEEIVRQWGQRGLLLKENSNRGFLHFLTSPDIRGDIDNLLAALCLTLPSDTHDLRLNRYQDIQGNALPISTASWTDELSTFVKRIADKVGWSPDDLQIDHLNETPRNYLQETMSPECLSELEKLTRFDFQIIERLTSDGKLSRRSNSEFDDEFKHTARSHGFYI